jgi:predicted nucleotide-binding protein
MRAAMAPLGRRIAEVEAFDPLSISDRRDPKIETLESALDETLASIFGTESVEYQRRYALAKRIDTAGFNMNGTPHHEIVEGLTRGRNMSLAMLRQIIKAFEEKLADETGDALPMNRQPRIAAEASPLSHDVFIVHGRDGPAKVELARVIERAGLNAIILHEQPNQGRTIIEKFERHGAAVGFAVILATPDDIGALDGAVQRPRARQNVIAEMGWFAGRLGRDRVCVLLKGDLEMPSDFAGVGYTEMDDRGAWKAELLKELQAAGFTLDWGRALA